MPTPTRGARLLAVLSIAAFVAGSFGMVPAAAQHPSNGSGQVLERDMRGEEAIRALGDHLPEVAAQNDMTPGEFRAALRADSMLWVGRTGQLLFVDEFALGGDHTDREHGETADAAWSTAAMPAGTDVFELESRPLATRVIVLDFNGHDARGTAWGSSGKQIAGAYDSDGDPSSFNQTEQEQIYSVWQRVSEDYAPLDVNVTTRDFPHIAYQAGNAAIRRDGIDDQSYGTRVVITPSQTYSCRCGGVAYLGVFPYLEGDHDYYQPAWVFTAGVGNGAKNIAEAASHEAGHNLDLRHDGTSTSGYYTGHGDWAPIMGVGYYEPISQWSRGEYAGANNTEDDFAVMRLLEDGVARGIVPVPDDDHSTPIPAGTTRRSGLIGSAGDTDAFTFTLTLGGPVDIHARPAAVSPNLDIQLELFDLNGLSLGTVDPPSDASDGNDLSLGLDARITTVLGAGTYTVVVDGVGFGDPASTGYSDYGSVGRYTLDATITDDGSTGDGSGDGGGTTDPDPAGPPAAPSDFAVAGGTDGTATLSWTDNSDDETGFEIQREFRHKSGQWRGTTTWTVGAGATSHVDSPGSGTFRYRIRAVNGLGASAYANSLDGWVEVTVSGGGGGGGGGGKGPNKGGSGTTAF